MLDVQDPILRVAHRFHRMGMAIGDIPAIIQRMEAVLDDVSALEGHIPRLIEMVQAMREGTNWAYNRDNALMDLRLFPQIVFTRLVRAGARDLFLALLQQYDMPAPIRKKVEKAAQFWAKAKQNRTKDGGFEKAVEKYRALMKSFRDQLAAAKEVLAKGRLHIEAQEAGEGTKILNAGSFRVVNTGGFSEEVMKNCAEAMLDAQKKLQSKGLAKVCYGDVLVSNRVSKSNVLAFYLPSKDEFFVRADLQSSKSTLEVVLHELGHRYHLKFAKQKDSEIHNLYARFLGNKKQGERELIDEVMADPERALKPGDTVEFNNHGVFVVDRIAYKDFRSGYVIHMHPQDDPTRGAQYPLSAWVAFKKFKLKNSVGGFITNYASKNHEEMFAEMFAFYCLDQLPDAQVELFVPLLK
jgi:hypothetical protein